MKDNKVRGAVSITDFKVLDNLNTTGNPLFAVAEFPRCAFGHNLLMSTYRMEWFSGYLRRANLKKI